VTGGLASLLVQFGVLLVELLVLLFVVSSALAVTVRRVGLGRLQQWLGGSRMSGTLKGMGVGFVVPFCTYSAIPTLVALIDARVRTATLAGFLLAAPLLDPLVLAVLLLLFGWQATLAYAGVTAATVLVLALLADALRAERLLRPTRHHATVAAGAADPGPEVATACSDQGAATACADPFADERAWRGLGPEVRAAGGYAGRLVRGLALPMVLAVALAAVIIGVVPEQLLARLAGPDNPLAVPTAAVLGAPFYVSTEAFLPVASALHTGGMGIGAVFALVISAAGVNLPEFALLSRLMRPLLLGAYTGAVVGAAVAAGYLIPWLL
jgi:uncharacterized protein